MRKRQFEADCPLLVVWNRLILSNDNKKVLCSSCWSFLLLHQDIYAVMYPPQSKKKKLVDGIKPLISYNESIALGQNGVITKYIQCLFFQINFSSWCLCFYLFPSGFKGDRGLKGEKGDRGDQGEKTGKIIRVKRITQESETGHCVASSKMSVHCICS